jgi:peptidoglycan/LPS O-acetylase OafA/YrhL
MHRATSTYLDLLRFAAAATVFAVHAYPSRLTGGVPGLWRLGNLGNDAVMVFFVLSGFVIAHVVHERERTPKVYAISRLARLYSVVVPAIALTIVADVVGTRLAPALYGANWYAADNPLWRIVANLTFVNELWFSSVRLFSNVPFWSLGYEFWYYLFFCVAVFSAGWSRVVALAALALVMGPKILLLLPVWLLGVLAYRATQAQALSVRTGLLLTVASLLGYVAFRLVDGPRHLDGITNRWLGSEAVAALGYSKWFLSSYLIGTLVALHLVGIAAISPWLARKLPGGAIRYLASFTFALYLFHYPLLHVYAAWLEHAGLSGYRGAIVIPATLLTVWLLAQLTERRKATVRRWLTVGVERLLGVGRRWALAVGAVRR